MQSAGPPLVVGGSAVLLWLLSGVSAKDTCIFLGYHALFVVTPGWATYRLLRPGDGSRFRQLVFGWALGYVGEMLAFAGTAAAGARGLLLFYPLLVLLAASVLWRRRISPTDAERSEHAPAWPSRWSWVVAAMCVLALGFVGVEYFASAPVPGQVGRVSYGIDTVWYLSLAGEALHHWPVADPTVSGQPLYYHLFSSFDPAAVTQVTGVDLSVVFLRLYIVPMVVLAVLGMCLAGSTFGGAWAGPLAAALTLFVGELNLDPHVGYRFANELGDDVLAISPSFLAGAALLAPLLALLCELSEDEPRGRLPYGKLALFGLLVIGAAGAKAPLPTVLAGGLIVYLIWHAVRRRSLHRPLLAALALTFTAFASFWMFFYGGAGSDQLTLHPPGVIRQMDVTSYVASQLGVHGIWQLPLWLALAVVGVVGAYGAQLIGLVELRRDRSRARADSPRLRSGSAVLLLALFAVGQLPYLLFTHPGLSQVFFSEYGLLAACLISAEGIRLLWLRSVRRSRVLLFAGACAAGAIVFSLTLASALGLHGASRRTAYLDVDLALAVLLALAYLVALLVRRTRASAWAYVAAAALVVGLAGRVLTVAAPAARQLAEGRPLYSQTGPGMTAGLYQALVWIRSHSSPSSVIAVNNFRDWSLYWTYGWAVPEDFNYSAFAERPTFLEGYIYTQAATQASDAVYYGRKLLFAPRVALNNAIFQWAHADALRAAVQQYGVRYLLVDRVHNRASPHLVSIAHLVYANRDAQVYAVPGVDTTLTLTASRPRHLVPARRAVKSHAPSRRRKRPI